MWDIRKRYTEDNAYRVLVDMMVAHIHRCDYTPSELREAAVLASIIYTEQCTTKTHCMIERQRHGRISMLLKEAWDTLCPGTVMPPKEVKP